MSAIPKPVVESGDSSFQAKAAGLKKRLDGQIPSSLRLPSSIFSDLPLDVTSIPASCGLLSASELAITELDATAVVEQIAKGQLTAVEVVTAFGKRAVIAHQLVNCLTDIFLEEGIAQAKEVDEYFKREGKVIGPLHGLPISIKDHQPIKGRWASAGAIATVEVSEADCAMVAALRSLGAVFYVKTNQPQGIMHLETHSFYGRTLNPYNTNLTPGGSSGGEGALNAMKGSCMGVGSDIGGSIRNPCANCGIYGMRPTPLILPTKGYLWYQDGHDAIVATTGPMCRSARDIDTFISAVLSTRPASKYPLLIPVPWGAVPSLGNKKLRVGIMMHDGVVLPHPPMLRALKEAKSKLEASGEVEVVDYSPYEHAKGYAIVREAYFEDGGKTLRNLLKEGGEDSLPLTSWAISPEALTKDHTITETWALHNARDAYKQAYSDHWNASGIDVLLCPPLGGTANPHDTSKYWSYTAIWNLVDYPGLIFPSGLKLDPSVDVLDSSLAPMSEADKFNSSIYDPQVMVGAPVSFQLVARRFEDQLLLQALKIIEDILKA